MTLGPRTNSRPPSSMPGTGSSRASMPRQHAADRAGPLDSGVLMAITGAVSVTP